MYYGSKQDQLRGNEYAWVFIQLLVRLMRRKNVGIRFGSLFMSFKPIMDFSKKILSFVSLIMSIEFNDV